MSNEVLEKIVKDWIENYGDMEYILVICGFDHEPFVSYAKNDYTTLLETYDLDNEGENFTPDEVIQHEISPGETGYIYKLDADKKVTLFATSNKL